jgi:hypothetical protein
MVILLAVRIANFSQLWKNFLEGKSLTFFTATSNNNFSRWYFIRDFKNEHEITQSTFFNTAMRGNG